MLSVTKHAFPLSSSTLMPVLLLLQSGNLKGEEGGGIQLIIACENNHDYIIYLKKVHCHCGKLSDFKSSISTVL